jgi:UTP--glucose-1-phosphate uridylyltransferase
MQTISKAIIPAAGWGTRMLPAAKAVPKELLPILDRPTIQYVVEEAASAGVDDLLLITQRDKRAIEDHFDRNKELEDRLRAGKKEALLESVSAVAKQVQIHAVRQSEQLGLGHAVLQAERHVGQEPCLCLLGDTIFSGGVAPSIQLTEAHRRLGGTLIALEEVPAEKVDRYGIAGGVMIEPGIMKIDQLIEKPSVEQAPSRYAICARYVLSPRIFECLRKTTPGKGGEIQLTDALKALIALEPVHGVVLRARRHDIGNPFDWLLTNLIYASRDAALWSKLEPHVRSLLK